MSSSGEDVEPDEDLQFVQRDPAGWLSGRTLIVVAAALGLVLLICIVIAVVSWYTPPLQPIPIPSVARG